MHSTCPAHIIIFDFITTRTGEGYKQCISTYHQMDLYKCDSKLNHLTYFSLLIITGVKQVVKDDFFPQKNTAGRD